MECKLAEIRVMMLLCFILFAALAAACLLASCVQNQPYTPEPAASAIGQGADQTSDSYVEASGVTDPFIQKTGWWAKDSYVHYGIMIHNPNQDFDAYNVQVEITSFDENGAEMFSSIDIIHKIPAGEAIGFAGTSGNGWLPTSVTIRVIPASAQYKPAACQDDFDITEYSEQNKLYFRYEVTGYITNEMPDYVGTVDMSVLLLDQNQNIVAGYTGQAYKIKPGQNKSFLITLHSAPDHASVQVYPQYAD